MAGMNSYSPSKPAAPKTDAALIKVVLDYAKAGVSNRQAARELGIDESRVRRILKHTAIRPSEPSGIVFHDKKIGGMNWRNAVLTIKAMQDLRSETSWSQDTAKITIGDGTTPIDFLQLSDVHIGAIGTDYDLLLELTDLIKNTPNLYVALNGDEVEMAIKLRGIAEICGQILDPNGQLEFLKDWMEEIRHKLVWSTWSNHSTMRGEQAIGFCPIKNHLSEIAPFFSGIGHPDVYVGSQVYKMAVSHKFSGVTANDVTAGCKRYLRLEAPDREIAIQGDAHRAGISIYNEGGLRRIALCSGTLNVKSSFARRHCSLKTSSAFPVLRLFPDKHMAIPFMSIAEALAASGLPFDGTLCNY